MSAFWQIYTPFLQGNYEKSIVKQQPIENFEDFCVDGYWHDERSCTTLTNRAENGWGFWDCKGFPTPQVGVKHFISESSLQWYNERPRVGQILACAIYKLLSNTYCAVFLWWWAVNPNILDAWIHWRLHLRYKVFLFIPCFVIVGWMQVFCFTSRSVLPHFTLNCWFCIPIFLACVCLCRMYKYWQCVYTRLIFSECLYVCMYVLVLDCNSQTQCALEIKSTSVHVTVRDCDR